MTFLVCGLGRCGSSLAMQMLAAGGAPCVGSFPDFEDTTTMAPMRERAPWFRANQGRAIKVLDPHLNRIPGGLEYRTVWLDRDLDQQAASIVKFAEMALGMAVKGPRSGRIQRDLARDRAIALPLVRKLAGHVLVMSFEFLIEKPLEGARTLAAHTGMELDVDAMAAAVRPRGTDCLPYMLEVDLVRGD